MNELDVLLTEEIKDSFENLKTLEPGSVEHANAVEDLNKLLKLKMEGIKNEQDFSEKTDRRILEAEQKLAELKVQSKNHYIKVGAEIFVVVLTLAAYGRFYDKGLEFEKTGTFTASVVKNLMSKFRLTK